MIDHFTLKVADYARSKAFYQRALKPLGYELAMEFGTSAGFGVKGKPDLWISQDPENVRPLHFALSARDRRTVDAFHAAAVTAGAADNGKPGIRKDYHPTYYAAFVLDPDGHNVEAVCHAAPRAKRARRPRARPAPRRSSRRRPSR
jgi:catechol 2,3-dioxygenase-like lactoylglutathione lyase family enzyme